MNRGGEDFRLSGHAMGEIRPRRFLEEIKRAQRARLATGSRSDLLARFGKGIS